ncbi:hypothetical protein H5410_059811 [Solanum commersonii]|uniref:Uncharacterized protein n=1 Tax=Solanum commersonii TaxID=4109 RepID=A0A9J5W3F9_SOLCO|nr:hypothetical protein H5410_059811 [Solanum commersonii]
MKDFVSKLDERFPAKDWPKDLGWLFSHGVERWLRSDTPRNSPENTPLASSNPITNLPTLDNKSSKRKEPASRRENLTQEDKLIWQQLEEHKLRTCGISTTTIEDM